MDTLQKTNKKRAMERIKTQNHAIGTRQLKLIYRSVMRDNSGENREQIRRGVQPLSSGGGVTRGHAKVLHQRSREIPSK